MQRRKICVSVSKKQNMKLTKHTAQIFTIDQFCSPQECNELIRHSNETGYSPATVNTHMGTKLLPDYRNNTRVFHTSNELAETFWQKLQPLFDARIGNSVPIGFNELFRFYKYEPGQRFKKHRDSAYFRNDSEGSYYTFLLYLNEEYKGGETAFENLAITPKTGMVLIFVHDLIHEGKEVKEGVKYVLRSDIMFRYMGDKDD
jgi:hypothetical protein